MPPIAQIFFLDYLTWILDLIKFPAYFFFIFVSSNIRIFVIADYASRIIVPACKAVVELSTTAKDLIERELSSFSQSLDSSLYMLPATPQALLEAFGANGATGAEAFAAAEKGATLLTARAGSRVPSSIPLPQWRNFLTCLFSLSQKIQFIPSTEPLPRWRFGLQK